MAEPATTRPSLLLRIRDARDREAWAQFVDIYAPLVYGYARRHGLQDADAGDLTQDVLQAVAGAVGRFDYDPRRGTFRGWLFTLVRNRLHDFRAGRKRRPQASGDSGVHQLLEEHPAPEDPDARQWEHDYEARLFSCAAEQVRRDFQETTWRAFWLTAVEGKSGKEAAAVLGITAAAVYLARRRVTLRLQEQIRILQGG